MIFYVFSVRSILNNIKKGKTLKNNFGSVVLYNVNNKFVQESIRNIV